MEKVFLTIAVVIFTFLFLLSLKPYFNRINPVKQRVMINFLGSYDLSKRDPISDRILFRLINDLSIKEIRPLKSNLKLYFESFSKNYLDLNESYRLIEERISSRRKIKILKNILTETVLDFSEEDLAALYVSGLDREYGPDYPIDFYREKMKLITGCFKNNQKNKKLFFELSYKKIEDLIDSSEKNIKERLILISEKAELCRIFRN
ncbi:MAG: hypothetical protein WCK59_00705 [Candidatus Falkowbacteria bacterium]